MSSYLIFVLVLTAVYIIYYAVIVTKDLYGKKDDAKTTEEVFDVSNMADAEESITVEENNGGFSIGGNSYDTQVDAVADYGVGEAANKPNGYNDNIAEIRQNESDRMDGGYVGNEANASSGESGDTDKESAFEKDGGTVGRNGNVYVQPTDRQRTIHGNDYARSKAKMANGEE